jgi:hypothetical protein
MIPTPGEAPADYSTVICRDDRLFPAGFRRPVTHPRALGHHPDEIDGGHTTARSRPRERADRLVTHAAEPERTAGR